MSPSIRTLLWVAFGLFAVFVAIGVGLTTAVLQIEKNHEYRILEESRPLRDAVRTMQSRVELMISAARAYSLMPQTQFTEQYEVAVREFQEAHTAATQLAAPYPRDQRDLQEYRRYFDEIKRLTDRQMLLSREGDRPHALEVASEVSRIRSTTPDHAKMIIDRRRQQDAKALQTLNDFRQWVMVSMMLIAIAIIAAAALAAWRIEQSLASSITREVKRTEAMIGGMADGVMLVDKEGRTQFINPAGQRLLGRSDIGVPIFRHAEVYNLRNASGQPVNETELPAAQALATGRPAQDCLITIASHDRHVTVLMSATPLKEEGQIAGVVVTFRDITERRKLEEEMRQQAERAQILAEAGAFFSSNIDPEWVTQAIAERVAEALGDWAAVVLKSGEKELRVASIYHRDMASLGLAWSYIYRQPLIVGEGIIGQVVATGYPSLTTNVGTNAIQEDMTSYHPPSSLASLLVLPLRTRRETLGALLIAANDSTRAISDENLPVAELLAERAAVAIENSKLYTEQVEARRKVEDLSRLKDEFLSIASHELRTPVTSIKGYTQLAKTLIRENDLATSEEYLDIALDQIDRMSRLILELLDVSRIETGRLEIRREQIQWTSFVSDVVHRHHTAVSDRRFHVSMPVDGKFVSGDRDRLEQVLGNLLENAVKYSPDGSEITVTVEQRGDDVVTSVSDRGIGIPPDELQQVFERFHRGRKVSSTNYGGLGLGLYITKQIVERHGGSIWVESVEGTGTTFSFSLPTVSVTQTAQAPAAAHA